MEQFERFAQPNLFVEESDIAPIIIKYADFNEVRHNEKNDTLFKDAIKNYEGIHNCVFVNDGISKGKNARAQFLIILDDIDLSIRVQIDGSSRSSLALLYYLKNLLFQATRMNLLDVDVISALLIITLTRLMLQPR